MKLVYKYALIIYTLSLLLFIYSCNTEDVTIGLPTTFGSFNVPAKRLASEPFELTPPTSDRLGSFSYTSSNPAVAVINGSILTIVGIGTTTITATQSQYLKYSAQSTRATFNVTEFDPPILGSFSIPSKVMGDAPFQLTPPSSNSAGAFTYTSSNPLVATINGSMVTVVGVGNTTISANQAANGIYSSANVSATLEVIIPPANIASDNFQGSVGTALTDNGWIAHSSTGTNPIVTISPGLTFADYYGSGIGNAAGVTSIGQDVSLQFATITSGVVYASFLFNASASSLVDGYFFGFGDFATTGTSYRGKLSINQDATDKTKFQFGFAANTTIHYSTNLYEYGKTYLVVVKYKIVPAGILNANANAGRDETSVYVFDATANFKMEPVTPTIGIDDTSSADILPGRVVLRQDNVISPNVTIDGLRVDTSWNLRN